jgi:hypothetical protein
MKQNKKELMAEWNNLLADSINEDEDWKYFSAKIVDGFGPIYSTTLHTIKVLPTLKPSLGQLLGTKINVFSLVCIYIVGHDFCCPTATTVLYVVLKLETFLPQTQ